MLKLVKLGQIKQTYALKQIRKTFPSWLSASGIHINVLQKLMDHSNIEVTKEHYVKLEAQRMLQDVSKVRFKIKKPD